MQDFLINNCQKMGIKLSIQQVNKLLQYGELIHKWNKTYNLTNIDNLEQIINKHFLDSLAILQFIKPTNLLDIGSGAGLPGIVLAIMSPNLAVSTLDSVGKKCRFMQFVKTDLKLDNLTIINSRIEDLQNSCFMQITSRGFATIDKTLKLSKHLLCDNGVYLLMKGYNWRLEQSLANIKSYKLIVPNVSQQRYLLKVKI